MGGLSTIHRASRQSSGATTATAVTPTYEERHIVIAQGIQFRNGDKGMESFKLPDAIADRGATIKTISDTEFESINDKQRVHFHARIVWDKDEYVTALGTPGLHVIYCGHARYGRGPCFGPFEEHTEDWQDSTALLRGKRGIFRMGYPFIGVEAHEITEHGYTPTLHSGLLRPRAAECHPEARAYRGSFRQYTAAELDPSGELESHLGNPPETQYWGYRAKRKMHVLHDAGWNETPVSPRDLGGTDLQCRVFCHFGCSTYLHNYRIMRWPEFKGWRREGNERYCYWTTAPAYAVSAAIWLYHLFTYSNRNDFESWADSLAYTVRRTNQTLRNENWGYQLI